MGKRINLAELAREDVPDDYSAPTPLTTVGEQATTPNPGPVGDRSVVKPLPVTDIAPNPLNRRSEAELSGEEFDELVATVAQHGVLQPIVVCSADAFRQHFPDQETAIGLARWVALIGNRRLAAARSASVTDVPALVNDDRVASMYEVMLIENSHRRDLSPLHEAEAMQQVLEAAGSRRALAARIGRTHTFVNQRLALLGLVPELREALMAGQLPVERARELGTLAAGEQEAVVEAGPPYRRQDRSEGGNGVSTPYRRSISASSPLKAAESIRRLFTPAERDELIRLLSEQHATE